MVSTVCCYTVVVFSRAFALLYTRATVFVTFGVVATVGRFFF